MEDIQEETSELYLSESSFEELCNTVMLSPDSTPEEQEKLKE